MAKKLQAEDDLFVRRETILSFFDPSPSRSTFYEWVDQGLVIPGGNAKALKGYYKLNESLARLGLPMVDVNEWRKAKSLGDEYKRTRCLYVSVMAIFVEELLLTHSEEPADHLNAKEMDQMVRVFKAHQPYLDPDFPPFQKDGVAYPIKDLKERLAYVGGVLSSLDWKFKKLA